MTKCNKRNDRISEKKIISIVSLAVANFPSYGRCAEERRTRNCGEFRDGYDILQ